MGETIHQTTYLYWLLISAQDLPIQILNGKSSWRSFVILNITNPLVLLCHAVFHHPDVLYETIRSKTSTDLFFSVVLAANNKSSWEWWVINIHSITRIWIYSFWTGHDVFPQVYKASKINLQPQPNHQSNNHTWNTLWILIPRVAYTHNP